ncbi:hypothetical protein GCM10010498_06480 [Streptomyces cavourensis]|nr:hypothetical protein GCM10010498_06480 [Streptomyces cavourensis]
MLGIPLHGLPDPLLHPAHAGQLPEHLMVPPEIEGLEPCLDPLPVPPPGRLHHRKHPPVPERSHAIAVALPPPLPRQGMWIPHRRSLPTPAEQLPEHARALPWSRVIFGVQHKGGR